MPVRRGMKGRFARLLWACCSAFLVILHGISADGHVTAVNLWPPSSIQSISASDRCVLAGEPGNSSFAGRAHLLCARFTNVVPFTAPNSEIGEGFGYSTALVNAEKYLLVSAPFCNNNQGLVYSFNYTSLGAISLVANTSYIFSVPGDLFGYDVSAAGTCVAAGSPGSQNSTGRVFASCSGLGNLFALELPGGMTSGMQIGLSLALLATQQSQYYLFAGTNPSTGIVLVWRFDGASWSFVSYRSGLSASSMGASFYDGIHYVAAAAPNQTSVTVLSGNSSSLGVFNIATADVTTFPAPNGSSSFGESIGMYADCLGVSHSSGLHVLCLNSSGHWTVREDDSMSAQVTSSMRRTSMSSALVAFTTSDTNITVIYSTYLFHHAHRDTEECDAGYYGGKFCCRVCPVGRYCPAGATAALSCPAGTVCDSPGQSAPRCADQQTATLIGTTYTCPAILSTIHIIGICVIGTAFVAAAIVVVLCLKRRRKLDVVRSLPPNWNHEAETPRSARRSARKPTVDDDTSVFSDVESNDMPELFTSRPLTLIRRSTIHVPSTAHLITVSGLVADKDVAQAVDGAILWSSVPEETSQGNEAVVPPEDNDVPSPDLSVESYSEANSKERIYADQGSPSLSVSEAEERADDIPYRRRNAPIAITNSAEKLQRRISQLNETLLANSTRSAMSTHSSELPYSVEIPWDELHLDRCLGRGAYGEVFKGTYRGQEVAIKIMLKANPRIREEFRQEVLILQRLQHPNIVSFYGANVEHLAIVTDFVAQGSLFDMLRNRSAEISQPLALRIARDIAKGVAYLHSASPPIIHRDLKSPNVLIDANWRAKIADFGMSKVKAQTYLDSMCGSPAWMAPEVVRAERYTETCDVFSWGVVLWELMTRRVPYDAMMPVQILASKLGSFTLSELHADMPEDTPKIVRALVQSCTQEKHWLRPTFTSIITTMEELCSFMPVKRVPRTVRMIAAVVRGAQAMQNRRQPQPPPQRLTARQPFTAVGQEFASSRKDQLGVVWALRDSTSRIMLPHTADTLNVESFTQSASSGDSESKVTASSNLDSDISVPSIALSYHGR